MERKTGVTAMHPKGELILATDSESAEKIAYLAVKNKLKAIPVVDSSGHFIGAVSNRALNTIVLHETREDLLRFAGLSHKTGIDNILEITLWQSFAHRAPWLLLGLAGGLVTAGVVSSFEATLEKNLILAAYIPLIVYMSDAVGTQMEAFVIRDFAIDRSIDYKKYFLKQLMIVGLVGSVTATLLYGVSLVIYGRPEISFILGISLFLAIISSVMTGLLIPYVFSRLKQDPANASGPIATIIQDFLSVVIYFTAASWWLK
jgi:magnesium transporter